MNQNRLKQKVTDKKLHKMTDVLRHKDPSHSTSSQEKKVKNITNFAPKYVTRIILHKIFIKLLKI
jgi:hypothetical protein